MNSYLVNKCHKELLTYSFPINIYDRLINSPPKKGEPLNDTFNRNVFKNTSKEYYLDNGKIIYYDSLREVNTSIEEWIEIFLLKTRIASDNKIIYECYHDIFDKIKEEISVFVRCCAVKYHINNVIPDTLIRTYISVLESRYIKISRELSNILREEFNIYFGGEIDSDFDKELNTIYNRYVKMILKDESCNIDFYMNFREEIEGLLLKYNNSKKLIKRKKEEEKWNLKG